MKSLKLGMLLVTVLSQAPAMASVEVPTTETMNEMMGKKLVLCGFNQAFSSTVNYMLEDVVDAHGLFVQKPSLTLFFKQNGTVTVQLNSSQEQGIVPLFKVQKRWSMKGGLINVQDLGRIKYQATEGLGAFHLKMNERSQLEGFRFRDGSRADRVGYRYYHFERSTESQIRAECGQKASIKVVETSMGKLAHKTALLAQNVLGIFK